MVASLGSTGLIWLIKMLSWAAKLDQLGGKLVDQFMVELIKPKIALELSNSALKSRNSKRHE